MSPPPRTRASAVNLEPEVARAFDAVLRGLGSSDSRTGYEKDWVAWRQWLAGESVNVLDVRADDIERYLADMLEGGKAKATRARMLSVLREVYRELTVRRLIGINPAREAKNPKYGGPQRQPWLDEAELGRLLSWRGDAWLDHRDRLIVHLLAGLGWRRSAVAAITMAKVDVERCEIAGRGKGGKAIVGAVAPWLLADIKAWCRRAGIERGALLPRGENNPKAISGQIVYNAVKRVAGLASVDVERATPHALRRSLATLADRRGLPRADIQHLLGHASSATTERYLMGSREIARAPGEWMGELMGKTKGD